MRPILQSLKPHQRVNHIPGSGYYTSKVNLATSNISGIPPAFSLPDEKDKFLRYAKAHPEKYVSFLGLLHAMANIWNSRYFVQKSNKHRGIQIKKVDELDLGQENSFIQEYISNPLLINGRSVSLSGEQSNQSSRCLVNMSTSQAVFSPDNPLPSPDFPSHSAAGQSPFFPHRSFPDNAPDLFSNC